jgi:hypothetical protein
MSREQVFVFIRRWRFVLIPIAIYHQTTTMASLARLGEEPVPAHEVSPQTRSDPAPIFQCTGAGGGVVVSLGGDGDSIYVYCADVKS